MESLRKFPQLSGPKVDFEEDGHRLYVGGFLVPSVTQVIKSSGLIRFSPFALRHIAAAAERGTAVHRSCEDIDNGLCAEIDPEFCGYVESYMRWRDAALPEWGCIEQRVYSTKWNVAGIVDRGGVVDDALRVTDLKTSATNYPYFRIQLAGYASCLAEMADMDRKEFKRSSLLLRKDGKQAKETFYEDDSDFDVFDACCLLRNFKETHSLLED